MVLEVYSLTFIWEFKLKQLPIKEYFLREKRLTPSLVKVLSVYQSRNLEKGAMIDIGIAS